MMRFNPTRGKPALAMVLRARALQGSHLAQRHASNLKQPPFKSLMAANRGEIALRIMRAASELDIRTIGIYSYEDRYTPHRYKCDQSFMLDRSKNPVAAYLDIDAIIGIAKQHGVEAIHPGYGFLSENANFASRCEQEGIVFVGPTVENLRTFGDKTSARALAQQQGVPVVPGSDGPVAALEQAREFASQSGFPIIIKAAMGGGGRGMRVVRSMEELETAFERATSEAKAAFGDGTMFLERYIERPRHIEVQILGDQYGNVLHLYERDCSVQRRHQKVVEIAPAKDLPQATRQAILDDAVRLMNAAGYRNAGTVEFLVDEKGEHFFIEVNPRVQVEHTVTEEVTGVDIVQSQIKLASGASLPDLGLRQESVAVNGYAIQCRVTTENPARGFQPDTGTVEVYRSATGKGIRLDGIGFVGARITPFYDSLLVKVTAHAQTYQDATSKLRRALREYRIRGVSTNVPFLINVLSHPEFVSGAVTTKFLEEHPKLVDVAKQGRNRGHSLLRYFGEVAVNGPEKSLGAVGAVPAPMDAVVPSPSSSVTARDGWRRVLVEEGPAAFARAVRQHKGTLLMDTTWRDAHQSLLATRVRTRDIALVAPATADLFRNMYSLEMWGGATFDVCMRFLRECPWDRLHRLRELVPNIPFQMLLRGANAVGYTSYPDNVVYKFCQLAKDAGMDVFRVFDSLNYMDNLRLGIDAVGAAGGVVEASICYSGDLTDPSRSKYTLDYYLELARQLKEQGVHVLAIKDMAGLLKPDAATMLISALRQEMPDMPIHVHTHDTAGTGVASMLAAARAGADVVDAAVDSLSGMTSQPSMGALVGSLHGTELDTGVTPRAVGVINDYWEATREVYAPFESGQKSGSADVYEHEMPGGQYTNLLYQSNQLGLTGRWPAIKKAYAAANRLLGDIIKVTPSSKVVGDLAQFMVQNDLSEQDVMAKAETLSFPQSVVEYFQGYLGIPSGGFPEPLRSRVLKGKTLSNSKSCFDGRPGAEMPPHDFARTAAELEAKYGKKFRDVDVMSYVMYPKVFDEWQQFQDKFGDMSSVPTRAFVSPMKVGEEVTIELECGKTLFVNLHSVGPLGADGKREVTFDLNGEMRTIKVQDKAAGVNKFAREKADPSRVGTLGAPMPGQVVDIKVKAGQTVKAGQPVLILSAMKMETVVTAPTTGTLKRITAKVGENMDAGDLLVEIE